MENYIALFHNTQRCSRLEDSIRSKSTISLKLNPRNHSFSKLPLFEMNELTNRDVFSKKGMIGGNANNGKGDTYF